AITYAQAHDISAVVFQSSVSSESWVTDDLKTLLNDSKNFTLFAWAAGNASQDISDTSSGAGVARLQGDYDNIMAVGAFTTPRNVTDVQTVVLTGTPMGGTFTLTYHGSITSPIPYNADGGAVQTALEGLPAFIGTSDVVVTGNPGGPWTVTFKNISS